MHEFSCTNKKLYLFKLLFVRIPYSHALQPSHNYAKL